MADTPFQRVLQQQQQQQSAKSPFASYFEAVDDFIGTVDGGCGRVVVCGPASRDSDDEHAARAEEDPGYERDTDAYTTADMDLARVVILTGARAEQIEMAQSILLQGQPEPDFDASFGTHVVESFKGLARMLSGEPHPAASFDGLFGFTVAASEHAGWMHVHEADWDGRKLVATMARMWRETLALSDAQLMIDGRYTRPGILHFLRYFKENVESADQGGQPPLVFRFEEDDAAAADAEEEFGAEDLVDPDVALAKVRQDAMAAHVAAGGSAGSFLQQEELERADAAVQGVEHPRIQRRLAALVDNTKRAMKVGKEKRAALLALTAKFDAKRKAVDERRDRIVDGSQPVEGETKAEAVAGFWATALNNHPALAKQLTEDDLEALGYCTSVVSEEGEGSGFELKLHFAPNPFFSNTVLTKAYTFTPSFTGEPALEGSKGTKIEWTDYVRNLCWDEVVMPMRSDKGEYEATSYLKTPSFFHFFTPPMGPDASAAPEEVEETEQAVIADLGVAMMLRSRIIPSATLYFFGYMLQGDDPQLGGAEDEGEDEYAWQGGAQHQEWTSTVDLTSATNFQMVTTLAAEDEIGGDLDLRHGRAR
jgi:nucleosome assembly protein 1-like 1